MCWLNSGAGILTDEGVEGWRKIFFPEVLRNWVVYAVYADMILSNNPEESGRAMGRAYNELERAWNSREGQQAQYSRVGYVSAYIPEG